MNVVLVGVNAVIMNNVQVINMESIVNSVSDGEPYSIPELIFMGIVN